jgi:hypothetical protein
MQALIIAGALGVLIAPAFAQSTTAQRSRDGLDARARAIEECMEIQKTHNHDLWTTGGVEHMYQTCMANKGQMP